MSKKKWTDSEIKYLKRHAASKKLGELARRFDTDDKQVRSKLAELGLASKEGAVTTQAGIDPLVETFEKALKALHKSKWAEAEKLFQKVISEGDLPDLAGRARQYLEICRAQQAEVVDEREEDPFLAAVFLRNRGELDAALKACDGAERSKDERFVYLAASIHALQERREEAAEMLARAIELNPENRVHAFHDPDFAQLRKQQELAHLFGLA